MQDSLCIYAYIYIYMCIYIYIYKRKHICYAMNHDARDFEGDNIHLSISFFTGSYASPDLLSLLLGLDRVLPYRIVADIPP